ncbi:hypothetical protein PAAG_09007 [Paracoccidioides lutzii Pb01]|uniref:Uncharacterized protein n=1 Tax=Paracoccidioides lutzii (strain ATCC MYA-826 / Pb01) TaxID=502779 RepID=C1HE14_PARBA|nr:hypothetical protein PAAG_09007 [Paracoccidioides lutzii Pb01]EEH40554.1 hypothetical protein PAAG_09007 [Paracoccidioides lutzii Pb01]
MSTTPNPISHPAEDIPSSSAPPPPPAEQPQNPSATSTSTSPPSPPSQSPYHAFHTYPFASDAEFKLGLGMILGKPAGTPATDEEVDQIQIQIGEVEGGGEGKREEGELLLKAKLFYFAKKFPTPTTSTPLTPQGYKAYLRQLSNNPPTTTTTTTTSSSSSSSTTSSSITTSFSTTSSFPPSPSAPSQPSLPPSTSSTSTAPPQPQPQTPSYPTPFAHIVSLITNNQPIPGIQNIPDIVLTGMDKPSAKARRRKPWEVEAVGGSSDLVTTDLAGGGAVGVISAVSADGTDGTVDDSAGDDKQGGKGTGEAASAAAAAAAAAAGGVISPGNVPDNAGTQGDHGRDEGQGEPQQHQHHHHQQQ